MRLAVFNDDGLVENVYSGDPTSLSNLKSLYKNHLEIADDVLIGANTLITKSINESGNYVGIMPAQEHKDWAKSSVFIKRRISK